MEKSSQKPSFGQGLELADIIIKAIASAAKKTNADSDRVQEVVGKPGVIFKLVEDLFTEKVENKPALLRLISGGEKIMIEACDGKAMIGKADRTFKSFIDNDFKNWNLNKAGKATPETLVDVHEMVGDGTFVQIFNTITTDLEKIVMTQAQIIRFCEKYPTWLRKDGYTTMFLMNENDEYFVVGVDVFSGGLRAHVFRLVSDYVWGGEGRHRVVSPQLVPSVSDSSPALLSEVISTVTIPAITEKFVAKDKFVVGTGKEAKVKISFVGDSFKSWFIEKTEEPFAGSTICGRKLNKGSVDGPIISELGGEEKAETTLSEMYAMMQRQANGEEGELLNNGYVNIFYVRDITGTLRAVHVFWRVDGWGVEACSVEDPDEWHDGYQVFSRNSSVTKTA